MSSRPAYFGVALGLMLLALAVAVRPAAAQDQPIIVEADQIVYDQTQQRIDAAGNVRIRYRGVIIRADRATIDLAAQRLQATGNVVVTDERGQTLRGQTLTYDFQARRAELSPAATTVNGVNLRGERVVAEPSRILGTAATFTTCDPDQPAYRVTAREVEVVPGDRLIARQASLWLGSVRLFTLPQLTVSLRTAEATARSFPTGGYSPGEGFWVQYAWETPVGEGTGRLFGRLGTLSAQGGAQLLQYPLGSFGASVSATLQAGWLLRNGWGSPLISRIRYRLALDIPPLQLTPSLTWQAGVSWQDSFYGTGQRQSIAHADTAVTYRLDDHARVRLRAVLTSVSGTSPLWFDMLEASRRPNRLEALYLWRGERGGIDTHWQTGLIFHLSDGTTSVLAEYGRRAADRFHWSVGTQYNLVTHTVRLFTDSGFALTPRTYVTVQADYNVTRARFKELDLLVRTRVCDCIGVAFRYRVIRREFWLEVGVLPAASAPTTTP